MKVFSEINDKIEQINLIDIININQSQQLNKVFISSIKLLTTNLDFTRIKNSLLNDDTKKICRILCGLTKRLIMLIY